MDIRTGGHVVSEAGKPFFEPTFNRSVKIRARDHRLSSDGGVLLLREVDDRLGLTTSIFSELRDPRRKELVRYHLDELLRARIYSRALGYNSDDDADLLAQDPAARIATWDRRGDQVLDERCASQPTQSRLTDALANDKKNVEALRAGLPSWVGRHLLASSHGQAVRHGTLDVDSFPMTVCGAQQGGVYNGYYREKVYHPIVASFAPEGCYDSRRLGDGFVHAVLRAGDVHTASGAVRFIRQAVRRSSTLARSLDVRLDAGFTMGRVMDPLTDDEIRFVGRLGTNSALDRKARPHLRRPVGRPPKEGYEKIIDLGEHRADSWRHPQRLILVVVDQPDPKTGQLELQPRYFFLVTNWPRHQRTADELLAHYRRRGTFEDRLGELSQAISPRLSSPRFAENEVHFLLSLLSYNLLSILRGELERQSENGWDVERVQRTVLRTAVRVSKASRRLVVDVALSAVDLWGRLIRSIERWRPVAGQTRARPQRSWKPPPHHAFLTLVLKD